MKPLIVFDGECAWCSGWARFLLRRDRRGKFRFASRKSAAATALAERLGLRLAEEETLLVIESGKIYRRSGAVLHVLESLGGGWRLISVFRIVPSPLRDAVYDFVAKRRHRLATNKACATADVARERMLS